MAEHDQPRQPRCDPAASAPRIAEEDRLDPAELERQRQLATRRRVQPGMWR